jgi:hypothetical protein
VAPPQNIAQSFTAKVKSEGGRGHTGSNVRLIPDKLYYLNQKLRDQTHNFTIFIFTFLNLMSFN